jgi:Icc-related predicted phosphoesterase
MRIVHCSDWHGKTMPLPEADIYFMTGDMLPNFRPHVIEVPGGGRVEWQPSLELIGQAQPPMPKGNLITLRLDHQHEERMQVAYLDYMGLGYVRRLLGSPKAPVVVCRGNHDFTSLSPMVAGDGLTYAITNDPTKVLEVAGLKVGGFRGMGLHRGRWSDEFSEDEFARRVAQLPAELDVLVTHNPPCGILDRMPAKNDDTNQWISLGSPALLKYHLERKHPLKAHLFGHIHESYGTYHANGTTYSNAAPWFNVIDL